MITMFMVMVVVMVLVMVVVTMVMIMKAILCFEKKKKTYITQLGPVGHLVRKILSKAYIVQYILSRENQGTGIQKI